METFFYRSVYAAALDSLIAVSQRCFLTGLPGYLGGRTFVERGRNRWNIEISIDLIENAREEN